MKNKYLWISLFVLFAILTIISSVCSWDEKLTIGFGAALLFSILAVLIRPIMADDKIDGVEIVFVIFCSFLLIATAVTYASKPSVEYDKSGVIQILSVVIGGLITLYGVGMTIKYNRLSKRNDDIKAAKPNIFPISEETWAQLGESTKIKRNLFVRTDLSNLEEAKKTDFGYYFAPLLLANSDLSMCTLKGIGINNKHFIVFHYDNILLKASNCCFFIDYNFKFTDEIKDIQLVLGDMLGNTYSCYVSFEQDMKKNRKKNPIYITSVLKIALMDTTKFKTFEKKW